MIKKIIVVLFCFMICSCSNLEKYNFQPRPNVKIQVVLNKLTHNSVNGKIWASLYFDYEIMNNSQEQIYFQFDSIKVQLNGNISSIVFYNSVASVVAIRKKLNNGENEFPLYAVFPDSINLKQHNEFKILSYGFVQ